MKTRVAKPRRTVRRAGVKKKATALPRVVLEKPLARRRSDFLQAVDRSWTLFGRWVDPPATAAQYADYLHRLRSDRNIGHFVCGPDGRLAGVININDVVRGRFRSGYLGYYAFRPYAGRGFMRAGLEAVVRRAFGRYRLHRLEANIQPDNARSIALVESLGFSREGFSPQYLKIAGRWCDHERWALTADAFRRMALSRPHSIENKSAGRNVSRKKRRPT